MKTSLFTFLALTMTSMAFAIGPCAELKERKEREAQSYIKRHEKPIKTEYIAECTLGKRDPKTIVTKMGVCLHKDTFYRQDGSEHFSFYSLFGSLSYMKGSGKEELMYLGFISSEPGRHNDLGLGWQVREATEDENKVYLYYQALDSMPGLIGYGIYHGEALLNKNNKTMSFNYKDDLFFAEDLLLHADLDCR